MYSLNHNCPVSDSSGRPPSNFASNWLRQFASLTGACACFCSVNTPTKISGVGAGKAADLTYWEGAARMIASASTSSKIIVEKSTVPVKTAEAIGKVGTCSCLPRHGRMGSTASFKLCSGPDNSGPDVPEASLLMHWVLLTCRCSAETARIQMCALRSYPTQSSWQRAQLSKTCRLLTG